MASFVPSPTASSSSITLNTSPTLSRNFQMVHVQSKRQTTSYGRPGSRGHSLSPSRTSLSPISGISVEHRMISDLRNQLETQSSENSRLRRQIESATSRQTYIPSGLSTSITPALNHGAVPRSLSDTQVPMTPTVRETVESILARGSRRSPIENVPLHTESATEVLLRKQLSDAKAEITVLTEQLRNAENSSDQQKAQFRSAIEELQARLNETIVGRDSVLDLRKKESQGQEKMIAQLQKSVKDLDAVNRQQEKNLLEVNQRADSAQQTASTCSAALQQIRSLLSSQPPYPKGSLPYASPSRLGEDVTRALPPSHVVRLVEECLRARSEVIKELERSREDLRRELAAARKDAEDKIGTLTADNREKILHVTEDHNRQLESLTERATNARQQAAGLQTQLAELQEQSTKQLSLKTMELAALTGQYEALKKEAETEKHRSLQKIDDLTAELDSNRNNMEAAREEISRLQLQIADANLTLQSNKETLSSLNAQLKDEKEKTGALRSHEGQRLTNIQRELEARSLEVRHMQDMLETQKEQAQAVLRQKVVEVQCEEQKKAVDKTSQLLADLEAQRSESNRLSLELAKKTADLEQSNQSRDRLTAVLEETSAKLEELQTTHEDLAKQLAEKTKMIDILTQERDHYHQTSLERIKELDSATSLQNRLQSQVTEREHEYQMMHQEKINLNRVIESNERISSDARKEKDSLIKLLEEKTKQYEEVKGVKDDLNRKLKVREKKIGSLELEVKTLSEAVKEKHGEVEKVIEGKEGLLEELKTCQHKVTQLTSEREILETRYHDLEASQEKTRCSLQLRIQGLEHDLQMTLQALRATKSADARAVDIANNVQQDLLSKRNQVDSLQIRIHALEESLGTAIKEKSFLESEKARLEDLVSKLKGQMERFQRKLKSLADKRTSQKDIVTKLETALEKAALKHTDAQRLIEEQEQAIAKMTLRHQLELKALQRTLASKATSKTTPNQSSMSTQQRTTTVEKVQTSESATTLTKIQQSSDKTSNGVVASHFLQSASVQAMSGLVGRNYISPIPVVVLNTSGVQGDLQGDRQETSGTVEEAQNISSELKDLLEEVKSVFSANMAALKDTHSGHKEPDSHTGMDRISLKEKSTFNLANRHDIDEIVKSAKGSTPQYNTDAMEPPLLTSSPYKPESENTPPLAYKPAVLKRDIELQTPSSPVTNLLGVHGQVHSDTFLLKRQGHHAKKIDRETGVKRAHRQGTAGAAVVAHSVNGTIGHSARSAAATTKSYSLNRPDKIRVKDGHRDRGTGQNQGMHRSSEHDARRALSHQVSKDECSYATDYHHVSVPLRIDVPEPGHARTRESGLDLEKLNDRNRMESGDVEMLSDLIITDDDNSSITSVTSCSTDVLNSDQPERSDSLRSLKERLAALSQMGNQLQKGNKEMAGLIKRQDAKLRRCRQEELNAKRIINSR
ncbi:coiled-coil domain-containing protein 158-like isoform X2 [Lytechinus variegatus]|uniref:coiled-coil domain-containing protein 158-like isoform X2 n=1 Tax=Lytechinus variegatus TaxID=7654 RepID=UPI001BB167EE|nr:coiled-coil domain-containing protein 158-like isoform X2 [Lytechinus variegatus]